ncbi:hypothetical protein [Sphingomonas sp. Leaf4]|uniref:hypothetical protein n=1 Tax=Sphingomonas sp. Leaf4 TaxID=2876553 RepID=UPI001E3A5239|nr:hypothetical protein [Sphingomonas sp. Leaf4]
MDGITRTKHFTQRLQQRALTEAVVSALLHYGERRSSRHGIDSLIFTKTALVDINNELGSAVFKACEKRRNAYLIVSEQGMLITAARSHCKTVH